MDGLWRIDTQGIRPIEIGYDRLFAVGDREWRKYELYVDILVHQYDMNPVVYQWSSYGHGIGLLTGWTGHYFWDDIMPRRGYLPAGSAVWYGYEKDTDQYALSIKTISPQKQLGTIASSDKVIETGISYTFKLRVDALNSLRNRYHFKCWEKGRV